MPSTRRPWDPTHVLVLEQLGDAKEEGRRLLGAEGLADIEEVDDLGEEDATFPGTDRGLVEDARLLDDGLQGGVDAVSVSKLPPEAFPPPGVSARRSRLETCRRTTGRVTEPPTDRLVLEEGPDAGFLVLLVARHPVAVAGAAVRARGSGRGEFRSVRGSRLRPQERSRARWEGADVG